MFGRFTERAQRILNLAQDEARRLMHDYVGSEHILLALIREGEGIAVEVLGSLGIDLEALRLEVENLTPKGGGGMLTLGQMPFNPHAKKVLELSLDEARQMKHNYVGTEHLLLGLVREGESIGAQALNKFGATLEKVRKEVGNLLSGISSGAMPGAGGTKSKTPVLDYFSRDLTALAKEDRIDPVIGREDEIERVIQVLSRRTKNNPILVGDPGVGKTAIVEGLALKIISGRISEPLINKRVLCLDLAALVAGTKYRGEFEERLKRIVNEIRSSEEIILFIDEIHNLVGAGGAEGALDAAGILKPALARGELQCVGATTLDEYRKYVERDAALERRFQSVMVEEPSVDETVEILKGLRDRYEAHHRVKFTDGALKAAATLSHRYVSDRFLPDKAVDLIDEAGSRARLQATTLPPDFKEVEKKIEECVKEKESAVANQEFEKAGQMRDREKSLKAELETTKKKWTVEHPVTEVTVDEEDMAVVVSKMTGIPVFKLVEKETAKFLRMEEEIHERIIGQDEAISAISRAVRRTVSGLKDPKRPTGSFIFLGPTGVGKTELAKALAEFLFEDEEALIQIDMSEFMEKFTVSRLIGAPPGYVGYDEGGELTEKVRRKPYSVILLDEIEKAHPDIFNILLQVFEDGHLTDNLGHTVNFRNAVIIMTSNIGAREIFDGKSIGFLADEKNKDYKGMKKNVLDKMKKVFTPEFLNRIDETIVFHPLNEKEIAEIVKLMISRLNERLEEQKIILRLTKGAAKFLAEKGFDPSYGARPLRRAIQRYIEDPLGEEMLKGNMPKVGKITVAAARGKDKLIFKAGKVSK